MKHKHEDFKLSAVRFHLTNEDQSYEDTCKIFGCSETSLRRWIDRYESLGHIKRINRDPISYKAKQKHVNFMMKEVKKNQHITMEEMTKKLEDEFDDFTIGRKQVGNIIRDMNQTRKRTRRKHFPETKYNNPIDYETEMKRFFAVVDKYPLDKIICMDETSISYFMSPEYSRCQLGRRCVLKTSDNKVFQKLTLVAAICSSGIVSYTLYDQGGMTTDRLLEFLAKVLKNKKDYLIVMDNAPAHRKEIVRSTIETSGNKLVYCVPYSPRTNSIESWFSQLKHYMKLDKTLNIEQVRQSIATSLSKIKPEHYLHHFQYAYKKDDLKKFERKKSTLFREPKVYKL